MNWLSKNKVTLAVIIVWLFNVSACIGIYLGYIDWFLDKTSLNLIIQLLLLVLIFPIKYKKEILVFLAIYFIGFTVEVVGVNTGFPFGSYSYKIGLGIKFFEVPLLIGSNWVLLIFTTGAISNYLFPRNTNIKVLAGATFMLFLDLLMEPVVAELDFWEFTANAPPIENYISWFLISIIMHYIFQRNKIKGNFFFSLNLYLAQVVFFLFLNLTLY